MLRLTALLGLFALALLARSASGAPSCVFVFSSFDFSRNVTTTAKYDLTAVNSAATANGGILGKDTTGNYYYFQLCTPVLPSAPTGFPTQLPGSPSTPVPGGCASSSNAVSCQLSAVGYLSAGSYIAQSAALTTSGDLAGGLTLMYTSGTSSAACRTADGTRNSIYVLTCASTVTGAVQVNSITEMPSCNYTYQLAHAGFCPVLSPPPPPPPTPSMYSAFAAPRYDASQSNYMPYSTAARPQQLLWRLWLPLSLLTDDILIEKDTAYFSTAPRCMLFAHGITNNLTQWTVDFGAKYSCSSLTLQNGLLYLVLSLGSSRSIVAVNASNGVTSWKASANVGQYIAVGEGTVWAMEMPTAGLFSLLAYSATNGTLLYSISNPNNFCCQVFDTPLTYADGSVYVFEGNVLFQFDVTARSISNSIGFYTTYTQLSPFVVSQGTGVSVLSLYSESFLLFVDIVSMNITATVTLPQPATTWVSHGDGVVYVKVNAAINAYDQMDGRLLRSYSCQSSQNNTLRVSQDQIVTYDGDQVTVGVSTMYLIDKHDLEVRTLNVYTPVNVVLGSNVVIVGTVLSTIECYQ